MLEQTIRLSPRVTSFTAVCAVCAEGADGGEGWLASRVEGRLRLDQAHASLSCPRGHVLRVERERPRAMVLGI